MTWRSSGLLIAVGISMVVLTGCNKDTSSAAPTSGGTGAVHQASTQMSPEQKQKVMEAGKAHQAGGRARAQVMHRTHAQP